jgi:capsular exopolysaccharide synthesis family protein
MSRIFDALQHSRREGADYNFPLMSSLVAEVPMAAEITGLMNGEARSHDAKSLERFQTLAISPPSDSRLVSLTDQASLVAEKFRFLTVRLRQLQQTRSLKTLLITSTIPEEGKSTISANLAVTLAQRRQQRVLLLEGDLRRPVLSANFGLRETLPGLGEWLQSDHSTIGDIYRLEGAGLWFLPAGGWSKGNLELMQSERLKRLMSELTGWFDWIVIDSPPVAPLADTSVWMRLADGVLLVAREGTTRKRNLLRGLQGLEPSKLLGIVLNNSTNTDHNNYYQRYLSFQGKPVAKSRED